MASQKQQEPQLLISHTRAINKLLPYKTVTDKSLKDNDSTKTRVKKETPLFYNRPIHKARKHDLF